MVNYYLSLQYHPGLANVMAKTQSRKSHVLMTCFALDLQKNYVIIEDLNLECYEDDYKVCHSNVIAISSVVLHVK